MADNTRLPKTNSQLSSNQLGVPRVSAGGGRQVGVGTPEFPIGAYPVESGRIFTALSSDDIVEGQTQIVTKGMWSGNIGSLTTFFTSSTESTTQKQYYYDVWDGDPSVATNESQFVVAYGHVNGSGSLGTNEDSPTKAIYSQYKQLLLPANQSTFTFNNISTDHIYVINIARQRYRDKLDPGNWELCLAAISGSTTLFNTGSTIAVSSSNYVLHLIDDSNDTNQTGNTLDSYNVVSGSISGGVYSPKTYYGAMYPQYGTIVLNADSLQSGSDFRMQTITASNANGDNAYKLYMSISGAAAISSTTNAFQARSAETVSSTFYFIRLKNAEYNFSNNPSFYTGSNGDFTQPTFRGDPKVYVTTIGLYNNSQELVAVAKLSQPRLKTFSNEILVRVKMDF